MSLRIFYQSWDGKGFWSIFEVFEALTEKFSQFENPAQDARISFADNGEVKILPDNDGFVIDYDQALTDLKNNINLIAINGIQLKTKPAIARVRQAEATVLLPKVQEIIALDKLVFNISPWLIRKKFGK